LSERKCEGVSSRESTNERENASERESIIMRAKVLESVSEEDREFEIARERLLECDRKY